jgi:hypothetical protein
MIMQKKKKQKKNAQNNLARVCTLLMCYDDGGDERVLLALVRSSVSFNRTDSLR